jgi:hypothetical protein
MPLMRAGLRGFSSSDVPDLEAWRPDDAECFELQLTAFIGPDSGGGEEMFDFRVCTAAWLAENPPPKNFEFLSNTILMGRWEYEALNRAPGDLRFRTEGGDWKQIATRLSRYGRWQYEDYRE